MGKNQVTVTRPFVTHTGLTVYSVVEPRNTRSIAVLEWILRSKARQLCCLIFVTLELEKLAPTPI